MPTEKPYRLNVGIALFSAQGHVLIGHRFRDDGPEIILPGLEWQMPQGGIDPNEDPRGAMIRELWEETGVRNVSYLAETDWLTYEFPISNCTSVCGLNTRYSGPSPSLKKRSGVRTASGSRRTADHEHAGAEVAAERVVDHAVTRYRRAARRPARRRAWSPHRACPARSGGRPARFATTRLLDVHLGAVAGRDRDRDARVVTRGVGRARRDCLVAGRDAACS